MRAASVGVIVAIASAAPAYGVDDSFLQDDESTRPDIEAYQNMFGVDAATAERQIAEVPRMGALEASLQTAFPDEFAGFVDRALPVPSCCRSYAAQYSDRRGHWCS